MDRRTFLKGVLAALGTPSSIALPKDKKPPEPKLINGRSIDFVVLDERPKINLGPYHKALKTELERVLKKAYLPTLHKSFMDDIIT